MFTVLVQKSITLTVGAALILSIYWSIRISYAEFLFHQNTLESVQQAVRLDPSNARYHAWLAALLENNGQDPAPALETASRLNPLDSRVWIRRGLNAEIAGNDIQAEQLLRHAAAIDRLLEPRWTLMNFYFRRGDASSFWRWTKPAFAISYGDRTPLFDLCWKMRPDPASIAQVLPNSYDIQFQFLQFLLKKDSLAGAATLAEQILPKATPHDKEPFVLCADRILQSGDSGRAAQLWNSFCRRGLLPYRPDESITNPDFEHDPMNLAFDWHVPVISGVSNLRVPPGLRFTFTGQQPETCRLLSQTLRLEPGRGYHLNFQYRTSGIAPGSGLRLRFLDQTTADLAAETWTPQTLAFTAMGNCGDLALEYRRPAGSPRIEGTLEVRSFALGSAR